MTNELPTWVDLKGTDGRTVSVAVVGDVIVDVIGIKNLRLHADDTISVWARRIGASNEPE